jgi:hypothetical protein
MNSTARTRRALVFSFRIFCQRKDPRRERHIYIYMTHNREKKHSGLQDAVLRGLPGSGQVHDNREWAASVGRRYQRRSEPRAFSRIRSVTTRDISQVGMSYLCSRLEWLGVDGSEVVGRSAAASSRTLHPPGKLPVGSRNFRYASIGKEVSTF